MLAANGYHNVRLRRPDEPADLVCVDSNGLMTFVKCKRYALHHQVLTTDVQAFLAGHVSREGPKILLFITTSRFTPEALMMQRRFPGLTLIDGPLLVEMMQLL